MKRLSAIPIRTPYIDEILSGNKTCEFRSKNTHKLGPVALIRVGSGTVVATAKIIKVIELTSDSAIDDAVSICLPEDEVLSSYGYFAWVLDDVVKLENPVPYTHPNGAITWVTLDEATTIKVNEETRLSSHPGSSL